MLCQTCGAANPDDQDFCHRCNGRLLVVSGTAMSEEVVFEENGEESFSFDEHLLERISILEEAVKRTAQTVRQLLGALRKQEKNILINQTGVSTLREVLEDKELIERRDWSERWEAKMDSQLLALEQRERFLAVKDRVVALYGGRHRDRFSQHLEDAEYALFAYDIERAVGALEEAHKLDRDNYELAYFLGEVYFNEARPEKALRYFQKVLRAKPDHYEGLVFSGVLYHERGDQGRAEDFLKRAVALYPDSFLANFSLGAVYATLQNLARATVFLERAVTLDPLPHALFLLGRCQYEMGKTTAAIRRLREAVRHDPAFEEAHYLLGLACLDRNWKRKALESFRRAQSLNPKKMRYQDLVRYLSGHTEAPLPSVEGEAARWLDEGERFLAEGNLKRALTCYRKALAESPDHPTLLMSYAMLCLQLDRGQEIEAVTRKVLAAEPDEMLEATAYATLIAALRSQGKYREGNRIGRRLLREDRSKFTQTIAYYEMAYNLAEMEEELDEALEFAQRSLELAPDELRQFPLAALGWVHYKRRELDQAIDFLTRSSELAPSATTLTHLGMALLAAGRESQAKQTLVEARSLEDRGEAIEETMMARMKDSNQLLERLRRGKK